MHNMTIKLSLSLLIGIILMIGDKLEEKKSTVIKAFIDNLTHGVVGGMSWTLILILSDEPVIKNVYSIILSIVISSLIDLDHFIQARDWRLSAATSLKQRPFLHCTTLPIGIWFILLLISKLLNNPKLASYSWIILTSFLGHHIRDSTRRGLWFAPLGSTQNIPYFLYIIMEMLLPHVIYFVILFTNSEPKIRGTISMV